MCQPWKTQQTVPLEACCLGNYWTTPSGGRVPFRWPLTLFRLPCNLPQGHSAHLNCELSLATSTFRSPLSGLKEGMPHIIRQSLSLLGAFVLCLTYNSNIGISQGSLLLISLPRKSTEPSTIFLSEHKHAHFSMKSISFNGINQSFLLTVGSVTGYWQEPTPLCRSPLQR